jgi:hypothetical protein
MELANATETNRKSGVTAISCHATLDTATCAAFIKESRMELANATETNRKSGSPGFSATPH